MTTTPLAPESCACPGVTRRGVLKSTALVGATTAFGSAVVTMTADPSYAASSGSTIVVVSLRGAADGLSLVVPHGDPAYYAARPKIAVPQDRLVAADGFFGLHPALAPLVPLWSAGRLAAVHATGLPVANRSHFAAMEELEDADPGSTTRVGWLNRLVGATPNASALSGVAVGPLTTALAGPAPVMSFSSLEDAGVAGVSMRTSAASSRLRAMRTQWRDADGDMGSAFRTALSAVGDLGPARAQADRSASYPKSDLGRSLAAVARTIRGGVGVSAVTVDSGDWDMHLGLGSPSAGWMVRNATDLAGCIAAFFTDLGAAGDRVTLVTISEFGRRVQENANQGLDHGWGNVMFVAGAGVRGGQYYGRWPGLANTLDADLTVTTDYRSVLAEIVAARTTSSVAQVFPGFQRERVGVMAGQ
jgi:uncharacterized protein (DUF1501 family)